jgi:hypothetical protein
MSAAESPPRELTQRRTEKPARRSASPPRSNDTDSVPVEHPVTPDPAPVALAPLAPPAEDGKTEDRHEPKPEREREATHESRPKPKPKPKHERKQKAKPKHERESKPKPKEEPKPEEKPNPPKPKHDSEDEPAATNGGGSAEKDNGPDTGKPSGSERRPSR